MPAPGVQEMPKSHTPHEGLEPISCLLVMPFLGFILCKVKQVPSGQTPLVTGYSYLWRSVQLGEVQGF